MSVKSLLSSLKTNQPNKELFSHHRHVSLIKIFSQNSVCAAAFWVATADLQASSLPSLGRRRAALTTAHLRLDPAPLGCSSAPGNVQTQGHSLVPGFWMENLLQERQYLVQLVCCGKQRQPLQTHVKFPGRHVLQRKPLENTEAEMTTILIGRSVMSEISCCWLFTPFMLI